jgi:short-subunit dehydrogenase
MYGTDKPYTLITGASEGLGKALAIECASRGMNLVLVALPGIELYQLASFLRHRYQVSVCEFELDICQQNNCRYLWEKIQQFNISINMLINNAGCGGTAYFEDAGFDTFQKQIELNVMATVHLTHLFLPDLKMHTQSYILNVSSLAIFFYLAKKQVYGATKSFIYFFSKSLRKELKPYKVNVAVLCPGGINSNPYQYLINRKGSFFSRQSMLNPEDIAPVAIGGLLKGKERIIPGKLNRFFLWLEKWLPNPVKNRITARHFNKVDTVKIENLLNGVLFPPGKKVA